MEEQVVVERDGVIEMDHLPVKAGDRVKVILLIADDEPLNSRDYSLRGKGPYRFDDPTAPVEPDDWEL